MVTDPARVRRSAPGLRALSVGDLHNNSDKETWPEVYDGLPFGGIGCIE